jgi:hypothetical protein
MTSITVLEFGGKFDVEIDNNLKTIKDLKDRIITIKNEMYRYDNLKIIVRGSEADDNMDISTINTNNVSLIIVAKKCMVHHSDIPFNN